jgi:predicted short-subunit dehydrogenase-like oxidoreductase (DUF2520 family)
MKITIIGSGNVGTHLAKRLFAKGHSIVQVFSRNIENAVELAQQVNADAICDLNELTENTELIIISIKDDAIEEVLKAISFKNILITHTSGATPSTVFSEHANRFGIFYPLQTFSKAKPADFEKLPICIDANNEADLNILETLAQSICPNVYHINDKERAILHVCAVMVNNFTNHLFAMADDILQQENLSLDILKPLILETVKKIENHAPKQMQTGPAIRNDEKTIEKHVVFLEKYPNYQLIYKLLSDSIQEN